MSRFESWRRESGRDGHVLPCPHLKEEVTDVRTSDSDTVFVTFWCGACKHSRTEEVIGSLARAMADDFVESKRGVYPMDGAA